MTGSAVNVARGILLLVALLGLLFVTATYFYTSITCKEYGRLVKSLQPLKSTQSDSTIGEDLKKYFDLNPNVDNSTLRSVVDEVQRQNPNLPIAFWNEHKDKPMFYKNQSCAMFPSIFDLKFNNRYWQTLQTKNGTFQLYGAYYETRIVTNIKPAVRVLGMINVIEPTIKAYCQLWFASSREPVFAEVFEYKYVWNRGWGNYESGIYQPYLIACKIPPDYQKEVPASVSLVEKPCDVASNNLKVIYNKPEKKKDFAVCVKGLDFLYNDLSVRIVEWIELLGALGVDKIFFYELNVHSNISKVLQYYKELGRIEVTPHTLPAEQPNLPGLQHMYLSKKKYHKRQNEIIPYNDCFYKNIYAYRYIVLLDIDEVIIPVKVNSWKKLIDIVEAKTLAKDNERRSYYSALNVYFFDDYPEKHEKFNTVPKYMHMLQHVYRSKNFTKPGDYIKSFFNTESAITLNNHAAFSCLPKCTFYTIPTTDAQLQHYRADCAPELRGVCDEFRKNVVLDTSIWKFKDKVIEGTINTLKNLGFLNLNKTT